MPEGLLRATAQPRPCRHIVFSGVKRLGGCVRRQERSSLPKSHAINTPTSASRGPGTNPAGAAANQAGLWRTLPRSDRLRQKSARSWQCSYSAKRVIKRVPELPPTRANNTRQPGTASECWEIPVTPPRLRANQTAAIIPYGPAYAFYVRLSGSPASASSSRFKACKTSKQTTRWAPRQNANVQSASTSRQMPPGTFTEKPVPDGPDGFDEPRGHRRCRGRSFRASASYRSRRTHPVLSGEHPGASKLRYYPLSRPSIFRVGSVWPT
jgi:hypothetical protein